MGGRFTVGTLTPNPIAIAEDERIDIWNTHVAATDTYTITLVPRAAGVAAITPRLPPGSVVSIYGSAVISVATSAASNVVYAIVPSDTPTCVWGAGSNPTSAVLTQFPLTAGSIPQVDIASVNGTLGGTVRSALYNSAGSALYNRFVALSSNAFVAPTDGVATAYVNATAGDGITLNDGTSTMAVGNGSATAAISFKFPVKNGLTYTFAGTGLVVLGGGVFLGV